MIDRSTINRVLIKYAGKSKYLVPPGELFNRLKGETFIFFDTETTGLYANVVQITEIAAMAVKGDTFQELDKYHAKIKLTDKTLAKAKCEVQRKEKGEKFFGIDDCLKMQGYNPDDPELREEENALNEFYAFCEKHNAVLVAQNAPFDLSMINSKIDKKVPNKGVFDTKLFMRFYIIPALITLKENGDKDAERVLGLITKVDAKGSKIQARLGDILKVFGVDIKGWHGAFADVMSTIEATKNTVKYFEAHPDVHKEERYKQEQAREFVKEKEHIQKEKEKGKEYYEQERKRERMYGIKESDEEKLPELIMTVGIPGSGKSFWIKSKKGYEIVSPDEIRRSMGSVTDQSKNIEVYQKANNKVKSLLSQGKNVIYDATNLESNRRTELIKTLPPHIRKAKIFHIDPAEAKKRIKLDLEKGVDRSVVPDYVVDRMYQNYLKTMNENQLENEGFEII